MRTREKFKYGFTGLILISILVLAVFGNNGFLDLKARRAEQVRLAAENRKILQENKLLLEEIDRLKTDLDYVESIARQELGMVSEKDLILTPHSKIVP